MIKKFDELKSILLVDDDESSNFLHSIFINKLDLDIGISTALNGQEALDFILNKGHAPLELPCMVLLDLKMPVIDGWKFLDLYKTQVSEAQKQQIMIVLVTISDNKADRQRASNHKYITDFERKPLSDDTLKKIISKYVNLPIAH